MADRPRVLLADDHRGVAKALSRTLAIECDVVGVVADGSEVMAAAARLGPVVVVVDVNLPNVNGLDICRQLTRDNPRARVIVISAMIDDGITEAALAAGASSFVHKTAGNALVAAIQRAWTAR